MPQQLRQHPSHGRARTSTDEHARQLDDIAAELRAQACSPLLPEPLADRLRQKAEHLARLAADHRASRITVDQENS